MERTDTFHTRCYGRHDTIDIDICISVDGFTKCGSHVLNHLAPKYWIDKRAWLQAGRVWALASGCWLIRAAERAESWKDWGGEGCSGVPDLAPCILV
jgi:hypothetical protein